MKKSHFSAHQTHSAFGKRDWSWTKTKRAEENFNQVEYILIQMLENAKRIQSQDRDVQFIQLRANF